MNAVIIFTQKPEAFSLNKNEVVVVSAAHSWRCKDVLSDVLGYSAMELAALKDLNIMLARPVKVSRQKSISF
ncbi:hypothetical protein [Candidatus Spongiihabitans sp.]|uniref:hypothetical protein n=1 Tax=Candidatus Spongiihabitans sp. TaxID=3101308 RepID=UPI003C7C0B70